MRDETETAEAALREAVESLGHDLIGVSVDEYEDGAVVSLEVEVAAPNPHQIR